MNRTIFAIVALISCTFPSFLAAGGESKAAPFERLGKEELDKLSGKWEIVIDTKSGWKGKAVATFKVVEHTKGDYLKVQYDPSAMRGADKFAFQNVPVFPVQLIPFSQEKTKYLVVVTGVAIQAFEPKAKERRVTYVLEDDNLSVDATAGYKSFVGTKALYDLDLAWNELKFRRVKK